MIETRKLAAILAADVVSYSRRMGEEEAGRATPLSQSRAVLEGTVIGRNMQRHRHQEFIRFLNVIEKQLPVGKTIHAIVDNYAAHKHPNVRRWAATLGVSVDCALDAA